VATEGRRTGMDAYEKGVCVVCRDRHPSYPTVEDVRGWHTHLWTDGEGVLWAVDLCCRSHLYIWLARHHREFWR
jgi:hypothetical protein